MVWQPAPQKQVTQEETVPETVPFIESPNLKRLRGIKRLSIYSFWFLAGVAIANLSRFLPNGWILYWVAIAGVAGYLLFGKGEETEEALSLSRLTAVALALSCISFWDALLVIFTLPMLIFYWILPVWLVVLLGICAILLILVGFSLL